MTQEQNINDGSGTKIFFMLLGTVVAGALAFGGIVRANNLEEIFIYKEENRLLAAKEAIFKSECQTPRRQQESVTAQLEEQTGTAAMRMKTTYLDGAKGHPLYEAGQKIVEGEKYVEKKCEAAIQNVSGLKRGSSTDFVIANFFGRK